MRPVSPILTALFAVVFLSSCSSTPKQEAPRTYAMGEKVTVGHMVYTVFETKWETHLGQPPTPRVPKDRFFLVRISAVNGTGGDIIVPDMTIEDDNGNSYQPVNNGDSIPQWFGTIRKITPAEAATGYVAFDVPPRHYKLRVTDENGDAAALIDIPLSFNSEGLDPLPSTASEKR